MSIGMYMNHTHKWCCNIPPPTSPRYSRQPSTMLNSSASSESSPVQVDAPTDEAVKAQDIITANWEGLDDPSNPQNWPPCRRWARITAVAPLALVTYVPRTITTRDKTRTHTKAIKKHGPHDVRTRIQRHRA